MLNFEPLPIFEVRNFLFKYCNDLTTKRETFPMLVDKAKSAEAEEYFHAITEMEERLECSIEVSKDELNMLFAPLRHSAPLAYVCAGDMLIQKLMDMKETDVDRYFEKLRAEKQWIPSNVAMRAFDERLDLSRSDNRDIVLEMVSKSDMTNDEKLVAFDVLLQPDKYINTLERTMRPVIAAFNANRPLLSPLLAEYRREYEGMEPRTILTETVGIDCKMEQSVDIYPSLMEYLHSTVSFVGDKQEHIDVCIGALMKFNRDMRGDPKQGMKIELMKLLSMVSNPNRFKILRLISKKPAYGRELAAALDLTPGAVSHHLSILSQGGFIMVESDGTRVNYRTKTERFEDIKKLIDAVFIEQQE